MTEEILPNGQPVNRDQGSGQFKQRLRDLLEGNLTPNQVLTGEVVVQLDGKPETPDFQFTAVAVDTDDRGHARYWFSTPEFARFAWLYNRAEDEHPVADQLKLIYTAAGWGLVDFDGNEHHLPRLEDPRGRLTALGQGLEADWELAPAPDEEDEEDDDTVDISLRGDAFWANNTDKVRVTDSPVGGGWNFNVALEDGGSVDIRLDNSRIYDEYDAVTGDEMLRLSRDGDAVAVVYLDASSNRTDDVDELGFTDDEVEQIEAETLRRVKSALGDGAGVEFNVDGGETWDQIRGTYSYEYDSVEKDGGQVWITTANVVSDIDGMYQFQAVREGVVMSLFNEVQSEVASNRR